MVGDKIRIGEYKPDVTGQQPLWEMKKLSVIWSEPPPDDYLHVFVGLPNKLSPIVQQTGDASTLDLWPAITLYTTSQGMFERLETIGKNKISELHDTEPDFLLDFRAKLVQCRWIESGTEVCFFNPHTIVIENCHRTLRFSSRINFTSLTTTFNPHPLTSSKETASPATLSWFILPSRSWLWLGRKATSKRPMSSGSLTRWGGTFILFSVQGKATHCGCCYRSIYLLWRSHLLQLW
jgi:hypothetical protein